MDGSPLAIYINPGIYDHPIPYCRRCFKNYGTQWLDLDQFRKMSTHITGHWICWFLPILPGFALGSATPPRYASRGGIPPRWTIPLCSHDTVRDPIVFVLLSRSFAVFIWSIASGTDLLMLCWCIAAPAEDALAIGRIVTCRSDRPVSGDDLKLVFMNCSFIVRASADMDSVFPELLSSLCTLSSSISCLRNFEYLRLLFFCVA
jgi:hypothetical protein